MALGYRSIEEMEQNLTISEYSDWVTFFTVEGFPDEKEDIRTAKICSTISNMSGKTLKREYIRKIEDFLPEYWSDPEPKKVLSLKDKYMARQR
jgi:hypothetical protein